MVQVPPDLLPSRDANISRIAIYVCVAGVTYLLWTLVYAFLISPVKHVPGPFWARVSSLPYRWATFKARRSAYAQKLIEAYGPIVVIAPDQIHTSDENAMKIIYDRASTKTSFYAKMGSWKGVTSTLGKIDYASAAPSRANLIQCFQNRNLMSLAENIDMHVFKFVKIMKQMAEKGEKIDGVVWFRLLALDIVTDVLWGAQEDLLGHAGSETPAFLRRFFAFSQYNALKSFIPAVDYAAKYIGPPRWSRLRKDCLDLDVTARQALANWYERETKGHEKDVLSMLLSMQSLEDPQNRIKPDDLPAYMVEMMAAGSSTTSHTAAFACWALARHPDIQKRLREELWEIFRDPNNLDMSATQSSKWLDAVIKETMRVWPILPGPMERYLGNPIEVNGLSVPSGVIASTSALTSGRNSEVFPSPEKWDPERWFEATQRMHLNWTPFGYGSRACPGSNLAITELKYILGAIFRNLKAVQPEGMERNFIELSDVFVAGTVSGHCWLQFKVDSESP